MWNVVGGILAGAVVLAVGQWYIEGWMRRRDSQEQRDTGTGARRQLPKQGGPTVGEVLGAAKKLASKAKK